MSKVASKTDKNAAPKPKKETVQSVDWLEILQKTEMRALASISNEITQLISNTNTSANALATMILKDAALTSQVLKIANSVSYNTEGKKSKSDPDSELKRAIIRIGFNGIRCICISIALIDSIIKNPDKQQRLYQCLAQSFHTAVHARNVAQQMGCRSEDVFIAGLLQNLGELVFWTSPISDMSSFKALLEQVDGNEPEAAKLLTGMDFSEMSKGLAESWALSETLSNSFNPADFSRETKAINLGNMMSAGVEAGWESKPLKVALNKITKDFNFDLGKGMALLKKGADEAVAMANEYSPGIGDKLLGIEEEVLPCVESIEPVSDIINSDKDVRVIEGKNQGKSSEIKVDGGGKTTAPAGTESQELAGTIKPKNKIQEQLAKEQEAKAAQNQAMPQARCPDPQKQMELLDELWDVAEGARPVTKTCNLLSSGIFDAIGLERVAIFAKVPKKEEIKLTAWAGANTEHLDKDLVLPINDVNDSIFRYASRSNGPIWVAPGQTEGLDKLMTKPVRAIIGKQDSFFIAPIKSGLRVVAIVYADMAGEDIALNEAHFKAFSRLLKQASRALSS